MSIIMGIDTGGTYTDAVLVDTSQKKIIQKSKALTTHESLFMGIENSITALGELSAQPISRVVFSTTLATNAIIENKGERVGVILIGRHIHTALPCAYKRLIQGEVDYRGNVIQNIDEDEVICAAEEMLPLVDLIVVSCIMSVRNSKLESDVREIISRRFSVRVLCSHEVECHLGYDQRTITAVLNARLLKVMTDFINAIETVLVSKHIAAPIYIVKSDGSLLSLECVKEKPVETIFSGPAASIAGAVYLSNVDTGVVVDMGGTTSDMGIVRDRKLGISKFGAQIGKWRTHIKSADLTTIGLGGDSKIDRSENHQITVGPERVTPSCRSDAPLYLTPTDLLHCTGEYTQWNTENSLTALMGCAEKWGMTEQEVVQSSECCIFNKIKEGLPMNLIHSELPVVAVGAPAKAWFTKASCALDFPFLIPDHFEVANAVGAAIANVHESFEAIVRLNPQTSDYILFVYGESLFFSEKKAAIEEGLCKLRDKASIVAEKQHVHNVILNDHISDKYIDRYHSKTPIYIETRLSVTLEGSFL